MEELQVNDTLPGQLLRLPHSPPNLRTQLVLRALLIAIGVYVRIAIEATFSLRLLTPSAIMRDTFVRNGPPLSVPELLNASNIPLNAFTDALIPSAHVSSLFLPLPSLLVLNGGSKSRFIDIGARLAILAFRLVLPALPRARLIASFRGRLAAAENAILFAVSPNEVSGPVLPIATSPIYIDILPRSAPPVRKESRANRRLNISEGKRLLV